MRISLKILAVLLFPVLATDAQEWKFLEDTVLNGKVYAERNGKTYPLKAKVRIVGTDGSSNETVTDENGNYHFSNEQLSPGHSYVITYSQKDYSNTTFSFMNRTDKFTFVDFKGELPLVIDKKIEPRGACILGSFYIYFEENSSELNSEYGEYFESFSEYFMRRQEESIEYSGKSSEEMIVQIESRAHSLESEPFQLAQERGEAITDLLVQKGIDRDKIEIINLADSVPHVIGWKDEAFEPGDKLTKDFVLKITDPKEKEVARSLNSYAIMWLDYRGE